jgi:TRAP-type C4-dicarboxylate transport system permease small subunit
MDIVSIVLYYVLPTLSCCCCPLFVVLLFVVGFMTLRKRGKKATPQEAIREGVVQVSQVFNRNKLREQALADDDDERR